jgi:hypothetical protein
MMAVVVSIATPGCGEILEVPVTTSEAGSSSSSSEGGSETGGATTTEPPPGTTTAPDVDDASTSGSVDDGSSSSGGAIELVQFCRERLEPLALPEDGTSAAAMVEVDSRGDVVALQVAVRIMHPRISDLRLEVLAPDGSTVTLLDQPPCNGANIDAVFGDHAEPAAHDQCLEGTAAIMGSVGAAEELGALLRTPLSGTWTLEATDTVAEQAGTVEQVCVVLVVEGA